MGKWLKINGQAIYGTRPWKMYGEGETETPKGQFTDNNLIAYTPQDLRFTTKGKDLYVITLGWSDTGNILVKSLTKSNIGNAKILKVSMLGSKEKISFKQLDGGLELSLPKEKPCDYAYVFKISFDKMAGEHLESQAQK